MNLNQELVDELIHRGFETPALDYKLEFDKVSFQYGGISTAYSCGCNLRCVFCFSGYPRDHPENTGKFYSPEEVAKALIECAKKSTSQKLRVTGCEPTIGKEHLLNI
jgi:uncharacterized Fe-S cluster-containing radical SAM superfamily protein